MKGGKLQIILHLARGKIMAWLYTHFLDLYCFFPVGEHTFQECV